MHPDPFQDRLINTNYANFALEDSIVLSINRGGANQIDYRVDSEESASLAERYLILLSLDH